MAGWVSFDWPFYLYFEVQVFIQIFIKCCKGGNWCSVEYGDCFSGIVTAFYFANLGGGFLVWQPLPALNSVSWFLGALKLLVATIEK